MANFNAFAKKQGLPLKFPQKVLKQAQTFKDEIDAGEIKRRRDLRGWQIVTIDGDDAKDLDDAVSLTILPNGNYQLGVHIADVSHYVKQGTELDKEALKRATSVYLITHVIPMLPVELSNGLCSLNPQVDRLTLSCIMEIDKSGGVVHYELCESVIKTTERMTYKNVQKCLDGEPEAHKKYEHVIDLFFRMQELAKILERKRIKRGALTFAFPEPFFVMNEDDKPIDIMPYPITQSNKIIEEFMLIANETVARHMENLEIPLVYRVHEQPPGDKIEAFITFLKGMGLKLRRGENGEVRPKDLQEISRQIEGKDDALAVNTLMLRSLAKARYCEQNLGHFGLAAKYYCHFTSPIRRYPDLTVHRAVKLHLNGRIDARMAQKMHAFATLAASQSSEMELKSIKAEREWHSINMAEFMADKIGDEFDGFIAGVAGFGVFVQLPNLVEGLVHITQLPNDYYIFDEQQLKLVGKHSGKTYSIGDKLRVKLAKVNVELHQVDFVLVGEKQ